MNKRNIDPKIFKILSYVFIFWVVGFISPYRNEKEVKFHVGQGLLLTFLTAIMFIIVVATNKLLIENIFVDKIYIGGGATGKYVVNEMGMLISSILKFFVLGFYIIWDIIGLNNVLKGKDKYLPFIGRYSFINKIL